MRPGDRTTEQLMASVERGLYITRFYYTRLSHNRGCVMTGMTRDGTFLIENGELTTPVKNLRFTQSYVDALAGCQALSGTAQLNLNEAGVAMQRPGGPVGGLALHGADGVIWYKLGVRLALCRQRLNIDESIVELLYAEAKRRGTTASALAEAAIRQILGEEPVPAKTADETVRQTPQVARWQTPG